MYAQTRVYPYPKMSHVIPSQLFHDLNCDRWNCNVFSGPKKSEGTQITCDFWGGRDEAGGEAGMKGEGRGRGRRVDGQFSEGLATIRCFVTACRARPRAAPIC